MPDACPIQPLDDAEAATLLYALEELRRKTKELYETLPDSPVKENLYLHVVLILSASELIQQSRQLESRFSRDELRVMYIAVCELRDTMHSVLDSHASSEEARAKAFDHLKVANALLRRLKAELQRNGYELDPALSAAYS